MESSYVIIFCLVIIAGFLFDIKKIIKEYCDKMEGNLEYNIEQAIRKSRKNDEYDL